MNAEQQWIAGEYMPIPTLKPPKQGLFALSDEYQRMRYQAIGKSMALDCLREKIWDYFNNPLKFHEARAALKADAEDWERCWKP